MKIENLEILNFRGIKAARFDNLGETIIIAGPNGSGKSCVFDAIRFLKSIYGGYQQNEVQQWFGEFQINPAKLEVDILKLFNEKNQNLVVSADFSLSDDEKAYLKTNARHLLSDVAWKSIIPDAFNYGFYSAVQYSSQFRDRQPEVDARVEAELQPFLNELSQPHFSGRITAESSGKVTFLNSKVLSVVFNSYRPPHIGVIDYHGALRMYGRENVQAITLSFDQNNQDQRRQSSLYNYNAKYGNVKGEMAAAYVKDVLATAASGGVKQNDSLTDTLKSLFENFFPDKEFLGPQATIDGNLEFPVRVGGKSIHDLDELSSGEKEVLYGYLRMRNSAPKHSIILLDEPELHLNPRLIRGLPQFYRRHLSLALGNQMWLVSHSDALLREVVGRDGYDVFHMLPCTSPESVNGQLRRLQAHEELEVAIVDLVGDVAAYKPGAKAIIFEGGGDSDFDQKMASALFPELQGSVNLISGSNKVRVRALLETLDRAQKKGDFPTKFFAITDRDLESALDKSILNQFNWDVYHIENYLLEPQYIIDVWEALGHGSGLTADKVMDDLRSAARDILPNIMRHSLMDYANRLLVQSIDVGANPAAEDVAGSIFQAVERSVNRVSEKFSKELSAGQMQAYYEELSERYSTAFSDGSWKTDLPGREIFTRYVAVQNPGVGYKPFRNLILSKMSDMGHQPEGMKKVITTILNA